MKMLSNSHVLSGATKVSGSLGSLGKRRPDLIFVMVSLSYHLVCYGCNRERASMSQVTYSCFSGVCGQRSNVQINFQHLVNMFEIC